MVDMSEKKDSSLPTHSLEDSPLIPDVSASFLSLLTFYWIQPLISLGRKRPLEKEDLWKLDESRRSEHLATLLLSNFAKRVEAADRWNAALESGQISPSFFRRLSWKIKSRFGFGTPDGHRSASLALALSDTFFYRFWSAGILKITSDMLQTTSPLVTKSLISFATQSYYSHRHVPGVATPKLARGIGLAVGLVLMQFVGMLCLHHHFARASSTGVLARSALISAIYRRALNFSGKSRLEIPEGKITAHIGPDISRIDFCAGFFHSIWTAPVQLIVTIVLLIVNIHVYALPGIAVFLVAGPFQTQTMKLLFKLRKKVMVWTDKRVKLTQELVSAMRILKVFCWELPYLERLAEYRKNEMKWLRHMIIIRGLNMAVAISIPMIATVVSFASYALTGHESDPSLIFTSFILFNILRQPLLMFPVAVSSSTDAKNALNRIHSVFIAEVYTESYTINHNSEYAVTVRNADFIWDTASPSNNKNAAALKTKKSFLSRLNPRWKLRKSDKRIVEDDKKSNEKSLKQTLQSGNPTPQEETPKNDSGILNITLPNKHLSVAYSPELEKAQLRDISFEIPRGKLYAIVGPIGSGKSSILQALIGEMRRLNGEVTLSGTFGYCPQTPWIQNATLRDNILFGKPWDEKKYWSVIFAACLMADLEELPSGDMTEIGEKGITLSGGQKQRVNIARALYFNADIVALDDPLSAVDAHVGRHIFEHAIKGMLAGKTCILVTHALHVLPDVDHIIMVSGGRIHAQGTYTDLLEYDETFNQLVQDYGGGSADADTDVTDTEADTDVKKSTLKKFKSRKENALAKGKYATIKGKSTLMADEERSTGSVPMSIYLKYAKYARGYYTVPLLVFSLMSFQGSSSVASYSLTWWQENAFHWSQRKYMALYGSLGVGQAFCMFGVGLAISLIAYNNSRTMHGKGIQRLIFAPMSFFETTPSGRIMNRFSKDIDTIDNGLNDAMRMFLITLTTAIGAVVLIAIVEPYFLIAIVVLGGVYSFAAAYYFTSARDVKRLDNLLRSSLYAHFQESLSGLSTIRAYGVSNDFIKQNEMYMDLENRAYYLTVINQRWLGLRLDLCGCGLLITVVIIVVTQRNTINPSSIGLVLSYSLMIQQSISWMIRQMAEFQNNMNSIERMIFYADEIQQEAPAEIPENEPEPSWPAKGEIILKDVEMSYRPGLPVVLHRININVRPGESIGIVGRSGAGKSSIAQALFRMVELSYGQITIDGVDISKIGLRRLRQSIAMIPQDPLLFSGTLRSNLDPFGKYDDTTLWEALRRSWLVDSEDENEKSVSSTRTTKFQLDMEIQNEGRNLSVGERALVSLSRALVRDCRIVLMDEATANVDIETDAKIQKKIRKEFKDITLLAIAHRFRTIIAYDRVIVMDKGRIAQFDTPEALFRQTGGIFHSLCEESSVSLEDIQQAYSSRDDV